MTTRKDQQDDLKFFCYHGEWERAQRFLKQIGTLQSPKGVEELIQAIVPVITDDRCGKLNTIRTIVSMHKTPHVIANLYHLAVKYADKDVFNYVIDECVTDKCEISSLLCNYKYKVYVLEWDDDEPNPETPRNRYIDTEKDRAVSQNDINHPKWNPVRGFIEKRKRERERKRERLDKGLPRDELVSHIMKTKNMTLGEASRYVKEQGLYKTPEEKRNERITELEKQLDIARSQRGHSVDE